MDTNVIEGILLLIMIVALLLASEMEKLYEVAIVFITFMTALSAIYWVSGSPILALFQLTIYAGTTGVILFAVLGVFPNEELGDQEVTS